LLVFFTGTKAKSTELALGCIRTFYALSASNKNQPACQYWLSSASSDNKQNSGANQQASPYVIYRLVPILDTKASLVDYSLLPYCITIDATKLTQVWRIVSGIWFTHCSLLFFYSLLLYYSTQFPPSNPRNYAFKSHSRIWQIIAGSNSPSCIQCTEATQQTGYKIHQQATSKARQELLSQSTSLAL
jgi:hypothetical protein